MGDRTSAPVSPTRKRRSTSEVENDTHRHRKDEEPGKQARRPTPWLLPGYVLDDSDPDLVILRRSDGSFVATFSAAGATREGIRQALEDAEAMSPET